MGTERRCKTPLARTRASWNERSATAAGGPPCPGGGWKKSSIVWEGEYHVYGWEDDDEVAPTTELNREARRLRKHHNELFHRISWPWDRKET